MSDYKKSIQQNKTKAPGTILDERYELKEPVGFGGFSIVYDAVNLHTNQRVAIKECTEEENKERFMREARLLRDFSEETSIVKVLDYFEEDGIAYIVMEFLEGKTLRDEISENGVWDAEKTVRLFDPVMKTLERMHNVGVIHRDISPDNLMLLEDGSLKLLDFGAARENIDNTVSKMIIKASYSPPEQMDEKGVMGSWSDVYSTCATMYYCITGNNPEDALSRMFLDELKLPSKFGANILAAAEKTLMKGLSTEKKSRVQDMHQLRTELEKTYPILTEDEKNAIEKKKKRRKMLIVAVALFFVFGIGIVTNIYKLQIMMHITEHQELTLDGSGMTKEEFAQSARIVKKRFDVFTEGRYVWKQDENTIRVTVPNSAFPERTKITDYVSRCITPPMRLTIYTPDDNGNNKKVCDLSQTDDVAKVSVDNDSNTITLKLTSSGKEKLDNLLDKRGTKLIVVLNDDNYISYFNYQEYVYFEATSTGDGQSILVKKQDGYEHAIPIDLIALVLKNAPSKKPFIVNRNWERDIKWEDPDAVVSAGKNQVKERILRTEHKSDMITCIKYQSYAGPTVSGYDSKYIGTQLVIKNRLDAMNIPYAIGTDAVEANTIVIKIPADRICREEMLLLGTTFLQKWYIGNEALYKDLGDVANVTEFSENRAAVEPYTTEEKYKIELKGFLQSLKKRNVQDLYLKSNTIVLAKVDIDDAIVMLEKNSKIEFKEWEINKKAKGLLQQYISFYKVGVEQSPQNDYKMANIKWDEKKIGDISEWVKECPYLFSSVTEYLGTMGDLTEKYGEKVLISYDYLDTIKIYNGGWDISLMPKGNVTSEEAIKMIGQIFDDNSETLKKIGVETVVFRNSKDEFILSVLLDNEIGEYYISNDLATAPSIIEYVKKDDSLKKLVIRDVK